ncbi:MAG: hypothetical protein GY842_28690 [bacterium]|nr:hypothetical protein [bacterium]
MPASASLLDRYVEPLLEGNRQTCRGIIAERIEQEEPADMLLRDLVWPSMKRVAQLYRTDRINAATEHMAVRINRCISAQLQTALEYLPPNGKCVLIASAEGEAEEINGQIVADLFETGGWTTYFLGGGVPNDEILSLVGRIRPDILLISGTKPQGAPGIRALIDLIRDVGTNPTMNIIVSGGVFNRADALWKEVNADILAKSPEEALRRAETAQPREPEVRVPGAPKRRRRRKTPVLLASTEEK